VRALVEKRFGAEGDVLASRRTPRVVLRIETAINNPEYFRVRKTVRRSDTLPFVHPRITIKTLACAGCDALRWMGHGGGI
jgi:hypothetical protein